MMKRSFLALAACLLAASPALAEQSAPTAPGTTSRTCYAVAPKDMAGAWTLNVSLRFAKRTNNLVGSGSCTQATNPPGMVRTWLRGNYFPLNKTMTVMAEGYPITGKPGAAGEDEANVLLDMTVPFDGGAGTGTFACRTAKGEWAKYDNAVVTKVECPAVKPVKK